MNKLIKLLVPSLPSPLRIATDSLENAQRLQLQHAADREYHSAMENMLVERIERLRHEIVELSKAAAQPTPEEIEERFWK
jgi:hypothetical protein